MLRRIRNTLVALAAVTGVTVVLWAIGWFISGAFKMDSRARYTRGTWLFIERNLVPNGWDILHATSPFYAALGLMMVIFISALAYTKRDSYGVRATSNNSSAGAGVAILVCLAVLLGCGVQIIRGINDNAKDEGRGYADATVYKIEDVDNPPNSLVKLLEGAHNGPSGSGCDKVGKHDVHSCITKGSLVQDWEPRVASATGATYVMSKTSGNAQNTYLMTATTTYVYTSNGGRWTAIRDGKNKEPLYGVISWNGTDQTADNCRFTGNYAINRAFDGAWSNNLRDDLAGKFPSLMFDDGDMWGYCKDDTEPVVVIPTYRQIGFSQRTILRPAGIITVQGSPSGDAVLKYKPTVKAGEYPGPVYPLSLAAKQRDMLQWSASEGIRNRNKFGFDPTDGDSGSKNFSEYLLRSKTDNHLYWVTPLTPRSSDSQQIIATATTRADVVTDGALNTQTVYVLPDNDERIVNINDMYNRAKDEISVLNAGFFTAGGQFAEHNPLTDKTWQIIADFGGRPRYRVVMTIGKQVKSQVIDLETGETTSQGSNPQNANGSPESPTTPNFTTCGGDLSKLSQPQLVNCLAQFADELRRRQQKG